MALPFRQGATLVAAALLSTAAAPPQRIATRNGPLALRCAGQGTPTVILTAGAGDDSLVWARLQARLAAVTRTCAWDRPGFGASGWRNLPLDAEHLTDSLEAGLAGAKIGGPYVMVGHSLGSFESLMFAFRRPAEVAGIVLVDPAGPFQDQRLARAAPATYAVIDRFQKAQLAQAKTVGGARYSLLQNMFSGADFRQMTKAWRALGATSLTVLTAGKAPPIPVTGEAAAQMPAMQAAWSAMHDDIARLSTQGRNQIVPGASHYIYKDAPDTVFQAIERTIARSRARPARQ